MKSFGVLLVGGIGAGVDAVVVVVFEGDVFDEATVVGAVAEGAVGMAVVVATGVEVGDTIVVAVPLQQVFFSAASFSLIGDKGAIRMIGMNFCKNKTKMELEIEFSSKISLFRIIRRKKRSNIRKITSIFSSENF